jgi:uncharacterized membrane protein HdeD (DUF308 family)
MDVELDRPYEEWGFWRLLTPALGLIPIGLGLAALAWPEPTLRVAGALFAANLIVTGLVRAALSLLIAMYPKPYRVWAAILGVLTAALGIACLYDLAVSALLLALIVGIGWLFDSPADPLGGGHLGGWRFGIGLAAIPAAAAVLVWPVPGVANFVTFAAIFFITMGTIETTAAITALRPSHPAAGLLE